MKNTSKAGKGVAASIATIIAMAFGYNQLKPTHFAVVEYTDAWGVENNRDVAGVHSEQDCIIRLDTFIADIQNDSGTVTATECYTDKADIPTEPLPNQE